MKPPIIVFDLDGTLLDTSVDLLASLQHAMSQLGLPEADPTAMHRHLGFGGRLLIEKACAAYNRTLSTDEMESAFANYLEHYYDTMPGSTQPYPGVLAAISAFHDAGYITAICTNKLEYLSTRLIERLSLTGHFASNCGADTFAFRKPDPRHLLETIALAGGDPARSVMIGDSRPDIDAAKAAGIPVVAVDFGFTDIPVHLLEPTKVISHYDELTVDLAERLITNSQL